MLVSNRHCFLIFILLLGVIKYNMGDNIFDTRYNTDYEEELKDVGLPIFKKI